MTMHVTHGAMMMCSMGSVPSILQTSVKPTTVRIEGKAVATVQHYKPFVNIPPFIFCNAPANPAIIPFTPLRICTPQTFSPWSQGAVTIKENGIIALNQSSTLKCQYGGCISIVIPGQKTVKTP